MKIELEFNVSFKMNVPDEKIKNEKECLKLSCDITKKFKEYIEKNYKNVFVDFSDVYDENGFVLF